MDTLVSSGHGPIDLTRQRPFTLGRLSVDPAAHEIAKDGQIEHVQPLPLKVLVALAQRRGNVVSREELVARCWDGRIVGDDVINRAVLLLRGIAAKCGDFIIETVPKAGYRLVEASVAPPPPRRTGWTLAAAAVLAVVAGIVLWSPWTPHSARPSPPVIALAPLRASGEPGTANIAEAGNASLSAMLTNAGMPVKLAASSGGADDADLRLGGSVRLVGDEVEATFQIHDVRHRFVLLTRQFRVPRAAAADLPDQMGAFAATSLAATSAMMVLDDERPGNPRLTGELLRQLSMTFAFEDALATYQVVDKIAAQMPGSAIAQLGLAMNSVHALPLLPESERAPALAKARAAAERARSLAPRFGDVYWPRCRLYSPARFAECEAAMRKGFRFDPGAPFTAAELRNLLANVGRNADALTYDQLAVAAMPYMAGRLSRSAALLGATGDGAKARATYERAHRLWPGHPLPARDYVEGMLDRGDLDGATAFAASLPADASGIDRNGMLALTRAASAGDRTAVREACGEAAARIAQACIVALVTMGDRDGALARLDRAFPRLVGATAAEEDRLFLAYRPSVSLSFLSAPVLAPVRGDPRYRAIVERVGLLRYWRETHWPDFCTQRHEPACKALGQP